MSTRGDKLPRAGSGVADGATQEGCGNPNRYSEPDRVYDHTIAVMKSAIGRAKLAREQDLAAIRRLDAQARRLEQGASGPSLAAIIAEERARSHEHDGRSVFVWEPPADAGPASGQQPG